MKNCNCGMTAVMCSSCELKKKALHEITEFFSWNNPEDVKREFLNLMMCWVENSPETHLEKTEVSNQLFRIRQFSKFIDAAYHLRLIIFPDPGKN